MRELYRWGGFVVDADNAVLRCDGERVRMERRCFDMLLCLVRASGSLVSKRDLLEAVWPEQTVSDASIHVAAREVRAVIGQQRTKAPLECVRGRGYRFTGAVRIWDDDSMRKLRRALWQRYALTAAQAHRTPDEVIRMADALVHADVERYGPL